MERTIEPALRQQPVKEKALCSRGHPKNCDQERDQQENLKQAQVDSRKSDVPGQWNSRGVNRINRKKDERCQTQDGRNDRNKISVDLVSAKNTANELALQRSCDDKAGRKNRGERHQAEESDIVTANVKQRPFQKRHVHVP